MAEKIVSIVMPAFNEGGRIQAALSELQKVSFNGLGYGKEIIVVNDGSTDGTEAILKKAKGIRLVSYSKNRGKGFALRQGFAKAKGEVVAIQDADLEYDAGNLVLLLKEILKGEKAVYGSRFMGEISNMSRSHYFGNRFLSFSTSLLFGQSITDMETCQKMLGKSTLDSLMLSADGFDIEPEITARTLMQGITIKEIPIAYTAREKAEKKINILDGLKALFVLLRLRFFG